MATVTTVSRRSTAAGAWIAFWVMVIGGMNWGLIGLFRFNLVGAIFGDMSIASRVVYTLVGIATVYCAIALPALKAPTNTTRGTSAFSP